VVAAVLIGIVPLNVWPQEKQLQHRLGHVSAVEIAQFRREIGTLLGPGVSDGNAVADFQNGEEIFPAMLAAIHFAQHSVDGYLTVGGSANFDNRSFQLNDEANINIYDHNFAARMTDVIDSDIARSHELTLAQWYERPWRQRAIDWLSSQAAGQL
jgi:cardiolipin synthase